MKLWRMIERLHRISESTFCVEIVYKYVNDHFLSYQIERNAMGIYPSKDFMYMFINPAASSEGGRESRHNSLLSDACATLQGGT